MSEDSAAEGLPGRLRQHAATRGDRVAFRFLGRHSRPEAEVTWSDLWDQGSRQAARLCHAGLWGQPIGILCPNPRDFVVALAGVILAGAVAVPIPAVLSRRSAPRIQSILDTVRLAAVIAPGSLLAADWVSALRWPPAVVRILLEDPETTSRSEVSGAIERSKPVLLQFTSGSTSAPRGVLVTHANLAANCAAVTTAYALSADETVGFSWLPLHHDMGLVGHVLTPMWLGCKSVIMDPLLFLRNPLHWLEALSVERGTITSAPNFAYELCNRASLDNVNEIDLSCLTSAVCGGEPVLPETMERFIVRFAKWGFRRAAFAPSYGLAEATLLVATGKRPDGPLIIESAGTEDFNNARSRLTSLGHPVAGTRLRIVDRETGRPLGDGKMGEIEISGPSVGQVVGAPRTAWARTGDVGFISDGQLVVAGRDKEMLIIRGQNVFPADLEVAALAASPTLVPGGIAAIGADHDGTQALIIIAESRGANEDNAAIETLRRRISEEVAKATGYVPDDVILVSPGSLPRTTSGKLRRGEIANQFARTRLLRWARPNFSKDALQDA